MKISNLAIIIEDDEVLREILRTFLEEWGFQVAEFENGIEADQFLSSAPMNLKLIVSDIHMPMMNGIDLLKKHRLNFPSNETIFLMVTGAIQDEMTQKDLESYTDGILFKPFSRDDLGDLLKKYF